MDAVNTFFVVFIFAVVVEFLVNVIKAALPEVVVRYINPKLIAIIVGLALSFTFGLDLFALLGFIALNKWVPMVATGLIISAGSIPVHELIAKLRESRKEI